MIPILIHQYIAFLKATFILFVQTAYNLNLEIPNSKCILTCEVETNLGPPKLWGRHAPSPGPCTNAAVDFHTRVNVDKTTGLAEKLLVGYLADGVGDWTVMDDRRLTAEASFHMAIQTVVARVQLAANEPETTIKLFLITT